MITTAERDAMRVTAEKALPQTATIQRDSGGSDSGGGFSEDFDDLTPDVPCRVAPAGGGEGGVNGGRVADETTHIVTLPAATDVTEADRLIVDDNTYDVTLVRERGEWEITRRVEVKERH